MDHFCNMKIVILGESKIIIALKILTKGMVGKTSIYRRYLNGYFNEINKNDRTINPNCATKYLTLQDKKICLSIWVRFLSL